MFTIAIILLAVAALPLQVAAQQTRYRLIDLGTFGGPSSYKSVNAPGYQIINNTGIISAAADTSTPDPFCFNRDCFVSHATRWQDGVLTDLGALPGIGNSSLAGAINALGWSAGQSENGAIDPATGLSEVRAVFWGRDGHIIDLGTFGGNQSLATTLNDPGQVVGFSSNAIPDPFAFAFFPSGTQIRAFLWQNGVLQDLNTLGGPDAQATSINQRGQVAGVSYTNSTPNGTTGLPTLHPFLWDHGRMTDLGTLGGTFSGPFGPNGEEGSLLVNDRGQVIGISTLVGDQTFHPFLWDRGTLTDLGTLGGDNGTATWLTDAGDVVGQADLPTSPPGCSGPTCIHHGFLWKRGVMTDLGTLGTDPCSRALMMNAKGQIVGATIAICGEHETHAFLWENGGPMVDLNTLIPANLGVTLYEADNINERGEIVASGLPAGCDERLACGRIFLLIPCDANDASGCVSPEVSTNAVARSNPAPVTNSLATSTQGHSRPSGMLAAWRARLAQRYHLPGLAASPRDYLLRVPGSF